MLKSLTADSLAPYLKRAREIYVSGCSADILGLPELLDSAPPGVIVTGIFNPTLNTRSYANAERQRRCRTFFLNAALKRDLRAGLVEFCPWRYTQILSWLTVPQRFDLGIVMVAAPNPDGLCSFGTQADFLPDFYQRVGRLVGVVNPNMPVTCGERGIPVSRFDALLELDSPLLTQSVGNSANSIVEAIACHIANLIPDKSTIQLGIGRLPRAVSNALHDHRHLRVHSGLIDDGIVALEEGGVLDRSTPIVSGVALGSADLYSRVDRNSRYEFRSVGYTHSPEVIGRITSFVSVNSAIQVDLFGQVACEALSGRILASPGGLPDYVRGALLSSQGVSVISVQAKGENSRASGIVPCFDRPHLVTSPRTDVDVIVSEYGVARLRDLNVDRRAEALISIAAPEDRASLANAWNEFRCSAF